MMARRKTYYGVTIGILMVETYFRRYEGDIGNARCSTASSAAPRRPA